MTKSDILHAAAIYGERFVAWLDFIIDEEAEYTHGTNIIRAENLGDGQGQTFCGLTSASDGLDLASVTPSWVAGSYFSGRIPYWKGVAGLPSPLLECVANWRVNMGIGGAGVLLQRTLNARGASLTVDGSIGLGTITAANAEPDTRALCRACVAAADAHYRGIVARLPERAYALPDWLRRDQHLLSRFVDTSVPEEAQAILATPASPRVPAPRSLAQILEDLVITPQVGS